MLEKTLLVRSWLMAGGFKGAFAWSGTIFGLATWSRFDPLSVEACIFTSRANLFYEFPIYLPGLIEAAFIFILIFLPGDLRLPRPSIILISENLPLDGIALCKVDSVLKAWSTVLEERLNYDPGILFDDRGGWPPSTFFWKAPWVRLNKLDLTLRLFALCETL